MSDLARCALIPGDSLALHALDLLSSHLDETITLRWLARRLGVSASVLSHRFRAAMGKSPHAVLIHLRMRKAEELLAFTGLPVKCVANTVGYGDTANFARAFSMLHGCSPTAYRADYRESSNKPPIVHGKARFDN